MKISNPVPAEGINVSREHPLKEFLWLVAVVGCTAVFVVWLFSMVAGYFVRFIPFSYEQEIADNFQFYASESSPQQQQLQSLADRIAATQSLPEGMQITVYYVDDDLVNAFATLGGNIFIYRGLLEKLTSENALSLLLAHEIAHVKHRHPISALGRGVTLAMLLSAISGVAQTTVADKLIGDTATLTSLKFSRDQEQQADQTALESVAQIYGHINGSLDLFDALQIEEQKAGLGKVYPEFLRTHPITNERKQWLTAYTAEQNWSLSGEKEPLPHQFACVGEPSCG